MRIQFCGADRTVTGSCHLLEINGLRIFLDMGMYQGQRDKARVMNQWLPDEARTADAIILSHGHLDHCGKLPVIARAGYTGPIYCTPATADVARIVLEDAGEIQEEDAAYLNRRSREPGTPAIQPLYTLGDVHSVFKLFKTVSFNHRVDLGNGVSFTFHNAGHILGAAYVILEWTDNGAKKSMLFTADIGRPHTPILRDPDPLPGAFDHVITESTYGNAVHAPMDQVGPQLLEALKFCIERRSRLLVPAFAVGRTQTLLWYFQKFIHEGSVPKIPLYVDSPMGIEMTFATQEFRECYDDETNNLIGKKDLFGLSRITFAKSSQQSKQINSNAGPCVIIASSPTCEFGRILHHLTMSAERPDDTILFTGWVPPMTLGRRLQDGAKRVRIYDRWYDVRCQVRTLHGLSAHADGDELLAFLAPTLAPQTTAYVVHGEVDQAETFASRLREKGVGRALIPAMESSIVV